MKCRLHLPQNPVDNMLVQGWRELACKDGSKAYEGQPPASSYLYLRLDGVFCSRRRSPRRQGQRPRGGVRGEGLEGYITLRNHTCSRLKCPKTCALPSRIEEVLTEAGGVHLLATPKQPERQHEIITEDVEFRTCRPFCSSILIPSTPSTKSRCLLAGESGINAMPSPTVERYTSIGFYRL
jgi:hypothetical protein